MTNKNKLKWMEDEELNRWVECVDCTHEFFIESFELDPCCPMCGSKEYEESTREKDYLDYDELDGLL